jgi:hypothetical protein
MVENCRVPEKWTHSAWFMTQAQPVVICLQQGLVEIRFDEPLRAVNNGAPVQEAQAAAPE